MKNKFSKWDVGGGSRSIIQGLNLFTSRNLFKSLKSILMVVALLSLSSNVWGADKTLTFSLTSNPGGWPTANSTTLTNYTYTLEKVDYSFGLKNVKCNSGYLMLTSTAVLGLPAIKDYKLTKVVAKNSGGCSTSTKVGISSSSSSASYISGGAIQTWSTTSSTYTYNLSGTSNNTVYYLYVTNKNAQITELTLTYAGASTYTVNFTAGSNGSVSSPSIEGLSGEQTITINGNKLTIGSTTITANPNSGYKFNNWTNGGNVVTNGQKVSGTCTITANFVDIPKLTKPTGLSVSNITSSGATLSWNAVSNATSYVIILIGDDSHNDPINVGNTNTYNLTDLTASTDYLWTVKAIGDGSNYLDSEESETGNFTTASSGLFTAGETLFFRSVGLGPWKDEACVRAEFSTSAWENKTQVDMGWMYNVGSTDYKFFYAIVPSGADFSHVQLDRWAKDACGVSHWNAAAWVDAANRDGRNTVQAKDASDTGGSWYGTYSIYLKGSVDGWEGNLATFTDNSNGNFVATVSNAAPTGTIGDAASYEFKLHDSNGQWIQSSNKTLSRLKAGSTYNIEASFNIGDRENMTLTPTLVKASVRFDANGHGTAPSNKTNITPNTKISAPTAPSADGWYFDGWYTTATGGTQWNFGSDNVTESMVLYAHWTQISYTLESITVKKNPSKMEYNVGETLNTAGMVLNAHSVANVGGSSKDEDVTSGFTCSPTTLNTAGSQTITVTYSGKTTTFTVTVYDLYTVTLKDDDTELKQSTHGGSVNLPSRTTSCAGYTFEGWSTTHVTAETSTKPTIITAGSYTPTADIELWPVFSKTTGGGTKTDVINASLTSGYLSNVGSTTWYNNSKDSYFTVTGSETGNEYIMNSMGLKDDTYGYALRWNDKGWLQCSNSANNDVLTSITITGANKTYWVYASVEGESFYPFVEDLVVTNETGTFTLTGDTTRYLEINGTASSSFITSITLTYGSSSTTYIAEPECYETTITLAKGTDGKTDGTATAAKGSSTLSGYTAAVGPDHYHLLGYYDGDTKVIDASGQLVANAGSYTDGSANWQKQDAAVTLTAKWEINSHTLTWDLDGGTAGTGTITPTGSVAYGTVLQYTVEPTKAGKKFNGWSPEMISGTTTMPDNDQTYTAQWRDIVWTDYLTDCSAPDTWFLYIVGEAGKSGEMTANSKTVELEGNRNYGFKLYKNVEGDSENQIWYTDGDGTQNPGTITVDNCSGWNFKNTTPASGNTGIRTTATGNYTFSFEIVDGYPRVSVTYPTAYQVSYEANGGTGTMNPSDYCAAGGTITLAANVYTKADNHFKGWVANVAVTIGGSSVPAGTLIAGGATIQNINSNITLTAQWETKVTALTISQESGIYEIVVGEDLQLTLTVTPNDAEYGTTYTWYSSNTSTMTVSQSGVVTGVQANTGDYIYVRNNDGVESNHYVINVKSAACDTWGLHMWNTRKETFRDFCFTQVGTTTEWRTQQVTLPSNSDDEQLKVLNAGMADDYSAQWTTRWVPMIGLQGAGCGGDNGAQYAGQDAIGYFRINTEYREDNYHLAFQPVYAMTFGVDKQTGWVSVDFAHTTDAEYGTEIVEIPSNFSSLSVYVGTKRAEVNPGVNFIKDRSKTVLMNTVPNMTSGNFAGKFGKFYIHDNYCNESNFDLHFTQYYRLHYDLDGGETAAAYDDQFAWSLAEEGDRTFALAATPTKEGYTFLGWSVNSTTKQPGARVTLSDDVTATAIWAENYTVTYEIGGYSSSCSSETTHYCGEENIIVCDNLVVPTGYTFNGWTSNVTIGGKTSFKGGDKFTMPCSNVVFTADVTADEYDITYNGLEGATNPNNPATYTIESAFDFVAPGERAGYTFVGWFDAATDGNPVTGITLGSMGDVIVWAHWTANSYSVTLDKNGGDADGSATFVYNTSAPTSYVAATRNGYDLAGYYTTQLATGEIVLNADGSVAAGNLTNWKTDGKWTKANNDGVLFAKWKAITGIDYYVYHYKMNVDGTYPETPSEQTRGQGHTDEVKTNLDPKTYEGFVTPEHQDLTIVYGGENILKYYYERNKYELTWDFDGGTSAGDYTQGQVYHGATITYPTSVSKDGHCFMRWDVNPATMPMEATKITAQWAAYENYRTYCGNAVTFVANGGTGDDYVVIVDAEKLTNIPTVETAGFTREGYGFAGWMVNGDESKTVYAPGETINPITDGMIVNAVWISNPTINEAVPAITSTNNVAIASAPRTLTVANPDGLEATIHIAYKKNGEAVEKATNSEFRFCNTSGRISEDNIISSATSIATDFTIQYKPNAYNKIDDDYTLYITVTRKSSAAIVSSAEFNLKGRSLPEKFVIAVQNNSEQWLALPANMTDPCTPAGMPITVTGEGLGMTADASVAAAYSLTGHDFAKDSAFFTSAYNSGNLWAAKSTSEINDKTTTISSSNKDNFDWGLTPKDETLISYNMTNKNNGKDLRYWEAAPGGPKFGMYASGVNTIYFIAVTPREETTAVVDEWYKNKILFHLPFAMKSVSMTINGVAVPDADITIAERKIKTTGYVLYELGGNIDLVAASGQVMELIIDNGTTECVANIPIPQIIVSEVDGCSALPAKADVVVRDGGHLTIDITNEGVAPKSFNNVTIYPNSKISVPDGKYFNVKSLTFFGGIDEMNGEETNIYAPELSLKGTMKADTLIYRMRVNATHMMPVAFPYDVTISKIVREDKLDSPSWGKVGTDIRLETYDGASRAAGNRRYSDESTWTEIKEGTLTAGIGYAVAAQNRFKNYPYTILDFPMANPYKSAAVTEAVKNAAVQAHDAVNWYDKGWNLMGNPYLASITGTGAIKVNETEYDFVYIPTADGEDYYQGPLVSAHILPFKDFFVQVNETGKMYFDLSKRVDAPARMLADIERTAQFSISLAGANKTDITYFKVADNFTESYDIPGDNAKMFGSAVNTKVYSLLNGEDQLAQMALNADMTAQPIQLGYIAPESGEYIFALDNTYTEYQNVEHIYLLENGEIKVDLLNAQYTFTTEAKTEDERFAILIVMKGAKMPTDLMDGLFNNDVASPKKVIYNDHFYILNTNRRVYDGTGKYINKMQENR